MARLLIVDDDQGTLSWMRVALESVGHEVRLAHGAQEAFAVVHDWPPDLVLTDILMPQMDGFIFAAKLQRVRRVPIMFVSIARREAEAILRGAAGYVSKPVTAPDLRNAVERVIGRHAAGSSILIVDDDESIREVYQSMLEPRFKVLEAANGRDALEVLARESAALAIVDVHMPVMNGVEFVKRLRADPRLEQLPVIVQTSDAASVRAPVWVDLHVDQTLLKDDFMEWLLARIDEHTTEIAQSRPLSSHHARG